MNKLRVVFFFALLAIVVAIARWNSNPKSQAESPTFPTPASQIASSTTAPVPEMPAATPSPQLNQNPAADFRKVSERVNPAVILVSVFDNSGKLLRTGTGFFVADDGRFVTSKYVVEGGANAVAKMNDGRIYNVSGILAEGNVLDLAVLKAEPKKPVPFVTPVKAQPPAIGAPVAVIGSSLGGAKASLSEGKIAARKSDQNGEWLELSATISSEAVGSPVEGRRLRALYFTRATAPAGDGPRYHHIGLYAYRRAALERFVRLPPSALEKQEKLEQLRALEAGMRIDVTIVDTVPRGVDTPADLETARRILAKA